MIGNGQHPTPLTCPSHADLSAFHVGNLPAETLEAIATHVGACDSCLLALEGLDDAADLLVSELRKAGGPEALSEGESRRVAALVEHLDGPDPVLGDLGQYELLEELGAGGMGRVFKARHRLMDRVVALKILRDGRLGRPTAEGRFRQEIRALARLDHANIVRAHDADRAGSVHFLVMEYVEGTDLGRRLRERGPVPVAQACAYVRQAAQGLHHAHAHGLIHRDVKPANLILTPHGQVKVLDLGLALFAPEGPDAGLVVGTADYMAPEQWEPDGEVDGRADVYGLGCTLYCLLTGRPPFDGPGYTTREEKRQAHVAGSPPPLLSLRPDIPLGLVTVVDRMLAKDPKARYATPRQVSEALRPFAVPTGPRRSWRMGRSLAGLAALFLLAGLAFTGPTRLHQSTVASGLRVEWVRVSHFRGKDVKPLGDLGLNSFFARADDDVRFHVHLSAPAYCYLIALNPDGKDQLCQPQDETIRPPRAQALAYPADADVYFGLTDGAGVQAFVLLASRRPLPTYADWKATTGPLPWRREQADGVWQFDGTRFRRLDVSRGEERVRGGPPAVLEELGTFLRARPEADAVAAVAFPVKP
jgi:serine/threonine protein kinase